MGAKHVAIFPVKTGAIFLAKIGKKEWVPKMFQIAEGLIGKAAKQRKLVTRHGKLIETLLYKNVLTDFLGSERTAWYKDMLRLVNFYHSVDHSDAVKFIRENPDYLKGHSRDGIE